MSWDPDKVFYSFANLPGKSWTSDKDKTVPEEFFNGKDFEEYQFTNFVDMDKIFGHKNSLFGTKGLEVGNPNRTSKSFDQYNDKFGPALVRVIKENKATNEIKAIAGGSPLEQFKQTIYKLVEKEYGVEEREEIKSIIEPQKKYIEVEYLLDDFIGGIDEDMEEGQFTTYVYRTMIFGEEN